MTHYSDFNFFEIQNELDYEKTDFIDSRVLKICYDAEEIYNKNKNSISNIKNKNEMEEKFFTKIQKNKKEIEEINKENNNKIDSINYFPEKNYKKIENNFEEKELKSNIKSLRLTQTNLKSGKKCIACDLKKK